MENTISAEEKIKQKLISTITQSSLDEFQEKINNLKTLMTYYKCAMMEIETKFKVLNEEYSLENDRTPINSIKTRLKSIPSIQEKLTRLGYDESALERIEDCIYDIAGVRVVCSFIEDVYSLADTLLKQDDIFLIAKKDYIRNPKQNGYRSLHLIVAIPIFLAHEKRMMKVEVQLRTIAMDFWASLEHQIRYKKDLIFTEKMASELYECAEMSALLDSKMNTLRIDILK